MRARDGYGNLTRFGMFQELCEPEGGWRDQKDVEDAFKIFEERLARGAMPMKPKMKSIIIDFSDGQYTFMETDLSSKEDPRVVEVSNFTVQMWYAVATLNSSVQCQLRALDDEVMDRNEVK